MKYDSKLFYGTELGNYTDVMPKLLTMYTCPNNVTNYSSLELVEWINLQVEGYLYIDAWYPHYGCNDNEIMLHLNYIDDVDGWDHHKMIEFLQGLDLGLYDRILQSLGISERTPCFYTKHYVY